MLNVKAGNLQITDLALARGEFRVAVAGDALYTMPLVSLTVEAEELPVIVEACLSLFLAAGLRPTHYAVDRYHDRAAKYRPLRGGVDFVVRKSLKWWSVSFIAMGLQAEPNTGESIATIGCTAWCNAMSQKPGLLEVHLDVREVSGTLTDIVLRSMADGFPLKIIHGILDEFSYRYEGSSILTGIPTIREWRDAYVSTSRGVECVLNVWREIVFRNPDWLRNHMRDVFRYNILQQPHLNMPVDGSTLGEMLELGKLPGEFTNRGWGWVWKVEEEDIPTAREVLSRNKLLSDSFEMPE